MRNGILVFWGVIIVVIVAAVGAIIFSSTAPGQYDSLAQCVKDRGVKYYGAFWCPHCQATNALFGRSAKLLPYVECSTPDGQGQVQECKDAGVTTYPTWVRPDGERLVGEHTIEEWADFAGCPVSVQTQ